MSTPDLLTRATRFFLIAEQARPLPPTTRWVFWEMAASFDQDPATHLPALAAAIRKEDDSNVFRELARHPLPGRLSHETVPWYDDLVAAWEVHRLPDDPEQRHIARLALVRLDGCGMPDGMERPSRLPEWLAEARQIVRAGYKPARTEPARTEPAHTELARTKPARTGKWQMEKLEALAALADWRPAPRVISPPETLREWVAFWLEMRQYRSPLIKGIAARALLNLPEADLRDASIPMVPIRKLLHELASAIPVAVEKMNRRGFGNFDDYLRLLEWQPTEGVSLPAAGLAKIAGGWLDVTRHAEWDCRQMAWEQLIRWDRTEILNMCGIDLSPFVVKAVQTENDGAELWELAQWVPATKALARAVTRSDFVLLRKLEAGWQRHRQGDSWCKREAGWLGSIRLHQVGLASELTAAFLEAYLSAVVQEINAGILFVLAQWAPGPDAPPDVCRKWRRGWQHRLKDDWTFFRKVAAFALVRQALENGAGEALRRAALDLWRTGTEGANEVRPLLVSVASRFHGVRTHLAAGRVPDFEDEPAPPAQRQYPRLALPPGYIADDEWKMKNGELKMEN